MSSNEKGSNIFGDRKEELVMTPLSEKKSLTKDFEKGNDELAETQLMEMKSFTKDVEKGTDKFAETLLMEMIDEDEKKGGEGITLVNSREII